MSGCSARTDEVGPPGRAAKRSLGNTTKSVDQESAQARRSRLYALQDAAKRALPGERVGICCRHVAQDRTTIEVVRRADGGAGYRGLVRCGSVWACPLCADRITAGRRAELLLAIEAAKTRGWCVVLLTLTARHDRGDDLGWWLDAFCRAVKRFKQSKAWRRLDRRVGSIRALEVTHGACGWHPHVHELVFLDGPDDEAVAAIEAARAAWKHALEREGLDCTKVGFDARPGREAGRYVAKEMLGQITKQGRQRSRTVWQLLEAAEQGDEMAAGLFWEYASRFKGRRQLIWSPGLKDALGVAESDDNELVAEEEPAETIALLDYPEWGRVVRARARSRVLDVAETHGAEAVRSFIEHLPP